MQEEPDRGVGPQLRAASAARAAGGSRAPRSTASGGATSTSGRGEALVDRDVGVPLLGLERRIARWRRGTAATASRWRSPRSSRRARSGRAPIGCRSTPSMLERRRGVVDRAGPADPRAARLAEHRQQRTHEAAGARRPAVGGAHHRQAVGGDDERSAAGSPATSEGSGSLPSLRTGPIDRRSATRSDGAGPVAGVSGRAERRRPG